MCLSSTPLVLKPGWKGNLHKPDLFIYFLKRLNKHINFVAQMLAFTEEIIHYVEDFILASIIIKKLDKLFSFVYLHRI